MRKMTNNETDRVAAGRLAPPPDYAGDIVTVKYPPGVRNPPGLINVPMKSGLVSD